LTLFVQRAGVLDDFRYTWIPIIGCFTLHDMFVVEDPSLIWNAAVNARDVDGLQTGVRGQFPEQVIGEVADWQSGDSDVSSVMGVRNRLSWQRHWQLLVLECAADIRNSDRRTIAQPKRTIPRIATPHPSTTVSIRLQPQTKNAPMPHRQADSLDPDPSQA
jgi:hypothetical protein